ncbi:hypothetical protein PUN28_009395 [Cardiocondyla obscurior]|uniref:Uncharacterized protein n=1 Tax=Cardiocondyla obscurior TaxID=286306 RepID=A0AAW2FTA4_9HYME
MTCLRALLLDSGGPCGSVCGCEALPLRGGARGRTAGAGCSNVCFGCNCCE